MSARSQSTAADAIGDSYFAVTGHDLTIQTTHSKTMLASVINPEAEKIVRAAIQSTAPGLKITLLPAPATAKSMSFKKPRTAKSGSAQAALSSIQSFRKRSVSSTQKSVTSSI